MTLESIISCRELFNNLENKNLVTVDCRFDLTAPDWGGKKEYEQLHIPGAVYAHLDRDLSGTKTPQTGRHPFPEPLDFRRAMSRLGISNDSQVIVYDATSGSFAARLWFMLKYYGHSAVAVLDGGFPAWCKAGFPIQSGVNSNPPGNFTGNPDPGMIISTAEMENIHTKPDWRVLDARFRPERYRGAQEVHPIRSARPHSPNRGSNVFPTAGNVETGQRLVPSPRRFGKKNSLI